MQLWYTRPAERWDQALPAGNGRLGCMQFGGVWRERWQLNEDSVWDGGPRDRLNPDAPAALPAVQALLRAGRVSEAEDLARRALTATPEYQRRYQPLADLLLEHLGPEPPAEDYQRALQLETGRLTVSFTAQGTRYTRQTFASFPDGVLAIRLAAEGPAPLCFTCRLNRGRHFAYETGGHLDARTLWLAGGQSLPFCAMLRLAETDGKIETAGEILRLTGASFAVLLLAGATAFRTADPMAACRAQLDAAAGRGWADLSRRQLADFTPLMAACTLELPGSDPAQAALPTDRRLRAYAAGAADPGLEALYFQYGRYLLASSSRPGSLPANLQGLWNDRFDPPWGSKYTLNINAEMNYWPAARTGLAECELPLFDLLDRLQETGGDVARRMYGCRGFCAHHNTDLWADAAPQDSWIPGSYWPLGAAWLATHLWQHYARTGNADLLAAHYDALCGAVRFCLDFLEEDAAGYLVTNPSVSPENTYLLPDGTPGRMCVGATMDAQILRELFGGFVQAAAALGRNGETEREAASALPRLRPTAVGADGRILEWAEPYREAEPGHRHISHLFGLFPGSELDPDAAPALAAAARRTLETRLAHGGGHTGWSRAWIIGFWAHLHDGAAAGENLRALLAGSTLENLMDNHPGKDGPVFQIDGNLGAVAAVADCLAQGGPAGIRLLPALPDAWPVGRVRGLRLPGVLRVDLAWQNGKLEKAVLTAGAPWSGTVRYRDQAAAFTLQAGQTLRLDAGLQPVAAE